jgi:lipoprotein-anchoring transpeptidase ErfK/SrfK
MRRMAGVLSVGGMLCLASGDPCLAQGWPPWAQELFGPDFDDQPRRGEPEQRPPRAQGDWTDEIREGGARPAIAPVAPSIAPFPHDFPENSIVIDTGARKLYYVLADNRAYEYSIGVGREGFGWTGTERISRKQAWPDWYPPAEMRDRDPRLPAKMTGGIKNPLGATALYLGDTLYRIHGTNDAKSIGRAESSGCFRMLNSSALHLASITGIGTPVSVVSTLRRQQEVDRARDAARGLLVSNRPKAPEPEAADDAAQGEPVAPDDLRPHGSEPDH